MSILNSMKNPWLHSSFDRHDFGAFVAVSIVPDTGALITPFNCRPFDGPGSLVVKVTDSWPPCHDSSLVPMKTRRVGERCTVNLSRAQTSSRWCSKGCFFRSIEL
ncbi:hypothetical protein TNCV_4325611 [Trichonephila clavipes]|nr:hypothetical protein TNCV_4325611 [Trichonephila clavipes]